MLGILWRCRTKAHIEQVMSQDRRKATQLTVGFHGCTNSDAKLCTTLLLFETFGQATAYLWISWVSLF